MASLLNHQQKEIVESPLEPLLVIASAGTGKTRVLTERIIYLLKQPSILPINILAITFTNLAAEEMKRRISERIKNSCDIPSSIGTIHSLFGEILRQDVEKLGIDLNHEFEIIDDDDIYFYLKKSSFKTQSSRKININKSNFKDIEKILREWRIAKYLNQTEQVISKECYDYEDVFEEYECTLQKKNFIDYDGILILACKLFEENPDIRDYWKNRFKAILVDECQDLNEIQWRLIKHLISDENSNFLMVGDPNQCIYIFNGAKEDIFEDVKKEFPNLIIKSLDENYRSAKRIVELSNEVKSIVTNKSIPARDYLGEIVISENSEIPLKELLSTNDFSKWAVLFKRYEDSDLIIKFFIENNIPFRISFFRLLEPGLIKWVVHLFQISFFNDEDLLMQLLWDKYWKFNEKFTIGNDDNWTIELLFWAFKKQYSIKNLMVWFLEGKWKQLLIEYDLPRKVIEKLYNLWESLIWLRNVQKNNLHELAKEIKLRFFKDHGFRSNTIEKWDLFLTWLKNSQSESTDEASENLILNLRGYAEISKEDIKNNEHNFVTLSTIHKTKGLEWDNVIILDYKKLESEFVDRTEDKHLAYVAITRAKNKLFLILENL